MNIKQKTKADIQSVTCIKML